MKVCWALFWSALVLTGLLLSACAADHKTPGTPPVYVITNDDTLLGNSASFYAAGSGQQGPTLTLQNSLALTGRGIGGGFFGSPRLIFDPAGQCALRRERRNE